MILALLMVLSSAQAATQEEIFPAVNCKATGQFVTFREALFFGDPKVIRSEKKALCDGTEVSPAGKSHSLTICSTQAELNYGIRFETEYAGNTKTAKVAVQFGAIEGDLFDSKIPAPVIDSTLIVTDRGNTTLESFVSFIAGRASKKEWTEVTAVVVDCWIKPTTTRLSY